MITRIFLDLDDTLNSFTMSVLGQVFGCGCGPYDYHRYPVRAGFNLYAAYRAMNPQSREYELGEFWDQIPRSTWATTPKSQEYDTLLKECVGLVGRDNVCILTSPTKCPECLAGKLEWIVANTPTWMHRQYLIGARKHFCARPDALLIDDHEENVNKFREHGGRAILVPRPWNKLWRENTLEYLTREIETYVP